MLHLVKPSFLVAGIVAKNAFEKLCLSTSMKLIVSVVDKDSVCQQDGMIFFHKEYNFFERKSYLPWRLPVVCFLRMLFVLELLALIYFNALQPNAIPRSVTRHNFPGL